MIHNNRLYYYDLFGYATITIKQVYPLMTPPNEWKIYDNPLLLFVEKKSTFIPITILDPVTKTNGFGYLTIELYLS